MSSINSGVTTGHLKKAIDTATGMVVSARASGKKVEEKQWRQKVLYLRTLYREVSARHIDITIPRRVFVAYSVGSGSKIFSVVKGLLEEKNFVVVTGFDQGMKLTNREDLNIINSIMTMMSESTVYLSIMSPENRVSDKSGGETYVPSAWIGLENGMAIAMRKPIVIMVDHKVDEMSWRRVLNADKHYIYDDKNLMDVIREVVDTVGEKYNKKVDDMIMTIDDEFRWLSRRGCV